MTNVFNSFDKRAGMNVLVGCERSGVIREAFRKRGHDAYSCDLVPSDDGSPFHLQMDVRIALSERGPWDLFIAHPECRFLANSGVLRLYLGGKKVNGPDEARWAAMREAAAFFKFCLDAPVPKICVENPVMHGHAKALIGMNYTQSFQPYEFGEDASKRTCIWLKGLPKLVPTNLLVKEQYANQTPSGQNKLGPSPERSALRAKTYQGVADAMAAQWG